MKQRVALLPILYLLAACSGSQKNSTTDFVPTSIEIGSNAPHNAFTDLIEYKGAVYCSFREGSGHVPGSNGVGKILRTKDGNNWEDFALIKKEGIDLRDQKISVMPDGRMFCLMGGSVYDTSKSPSRLLGMYPHIAFMGADMKFTTPQKAVITEEGSNWIWRVTWYNGVGYGINYGGGRPIELVKTTDGITFEKITDLQVDGMPNESTIQFDKKGKMYILIRRDKGDTKGMIATGETPFTRFNYQKLDYRIGGPNFVFSSDQKKLIIGTRLYLPDGAKTGILLTDLNGKRLKTIVLESSGDCSYPGLLIKEKQLWVSYYSSHKIKTSIYFTKIPMTYLLK